MEELAIKAVEQFVRIAECPNGYGDGDGDGDGSGSGYGSGSGSGDDDGSGYGYGYGDGYDIEGFRGEKVYMIDKTPTIIHSVHINYARASILNCDLTLTPCVVAKRENFFAHGKTIKAAFQSVMEKYNMNRPLAERIAEFNFHYPNRDEKVPAKELFAWHHILTGSCLFGRQQWCNEHGIDIEKGMFSVNEFIHLTLTAYGGEVIKQLRDTLPSK